MTLSEQSGSEIIMAVESVEKLDITVEELLYDTVKWAFWCSKLLGYTVLSFSSKGKILKEKKWFSFGRLYPNICIFLVTLCNIKLYTMSDHYIEDPKWTDSVTTYVSSLLAPYVGQLFRLETNFRISAARKFWKDTCELLTYISEIFNTNLRVEYEDLFKRQKVCIKRNVKISFTVLFLQFVGFSLIYSILIYFFGWKFFDSDKPIEIIYTIALACWLFFMYGHLINYVWTSGFLRIYKCCFEIVSIELGKLLTSHSNLKALSEQQVEPDTLLQLVTKSEDDLDNQVLKSIKTYYRIESAIQYDFEKNFGKRLVLDILIASTLLLLNLYAAVTPVGTDTTTGNSVLR